MLQLYIDDGVEDRGHRHAMMNPNLRLTGMASCSHRGFGKMIVAVYAISMTPS